MPTDSSRAVFLSYASQDAEAARRICDTLRASGVEVWFDADGGLEHGDEWDAKIRRQIKECVLFIAVISDNTQARHEGYFRIEWDLAAERARGIASGVPFILPVVIDDTREPDALVPDRFRAVQWTKLRAGEVPTDVQQRFLKLWSHRTGVLKHEATRSELEPGRPRPGKSDEGVASPGASEVGPPLRLRTPWLIASVALALLCVLGWKFLSPAAPLAPPRDAAQRSMSLTPKTVAVLPFANQSDDKTNEFFSDGISEALAGVLGEVSGLQVAGWNSALSLKGKNLPEAEVAQNLGVVYVVTGSVQKMGSQVKISARLVSAADGFQLWSDRFTREAKDIFAVQDEIAGLIARSLQLKLGVSSRRTRVVDPEAHRLVLEGRHYWNQRNETGFARAETAFLKAIDLDPTFAEAHAGLASVYVIRADYQPLPTTAPRVVADTRKARSAAEKAVALGSNLAEANAVLAYVQMIQGEQVPAEKSFARALALNPQLPAANLWYAVWHTANGRLDAALESLSKAEALDPLWFINLHLYSEALAYAGRHDEALRIAERAANLRPDVFVPNLGLRAQTLFALGRHDEALHVARAVRLNKSTDTRWHADASAIRVIRLCGHEAEAREYASEVLQQLGQQSLVHSHVYAAAGDFEGALAALNEARMTQRRYYFWEPCWDPWRNDPRFHTALAKLGCVEEYTTARATLARLKAKAEVKK